MYTDNSTKEFPKTLLIRNNPDGCIWQVYHVNNEQDVENLSTNATNNGFYGITLEDYLPEHEETWPDWNETKNW